MKDEAVKLFNKFLTLYQDKYLKAIFCPNKDQESLLTFFNFPAAHWHSIFTTNLIESVFSRVKTKECLSMYMAETLIQSAQKRWMR